VVTRGDHFLEKIVEAADATATEKMLRTVNAGIYVLPAKSIFGYLDQLQSNNAKGELYLTDALCAAAAEHDVGSLMLEDWREALGVNTRHDLARVQRVLIRRHLDLLMDAGVTVYDPVRTVIEPSVTVGRDSEIHPGVTLAGATTVGEGCVIHSGAWIRDSMIADRVAVGPHSVLEGASVGPQASVGPFARLRPGADLGPEVRVGNFVEIKNARLERGVKAGHLAYLGDAEIGEESNIGAGTITCNYDGRKKHQTTIGRRAFIGSDTMLVAPVEVGDEAVTAAGSTITSDVPDGALGVGRGKQRNISGWSKRHQGKGD
jgi:bifunctional UDP-N-acetylglucosamine pyrophosphorylase/glucosamine-1-phosphate N-acetyltransferase